MCARRSSRSRTRSAPRGARPRRNCGSRREELRRNEERFERGEQQAETRHAELERREKELARIARELQAMRQEIDRAGSQTRKELERVSRMTAQEARESLVKQIIGDAKRDAMGTVREIEQQAREEGENRARKIVTIAIQRVASDLTSESTVSVFPLPSDDMKGRIIGREGRNIRTFEALTGVNLIIDDTPEAVVLSSFDPVRREVARLTLEKLVADDESTTASGVSSMIRLTPVRASKVRMLRPSPADDPALHVVAGTGNTDTVRFGRRVRGHPLDGDASRSFGPGSRLPLAPAARSRAPCPWRRASRRP